MTETAVSQPSSSQPTADSALVQAPQNLSPPDAATQDDLSHMTASAIDSLPFGYIALSPDGTVRKYNRYEADLARKDPKDVLGKNFFREVAPCTQVQEFEGRFRQFVSGENGSTQLAFEFNFAFRHGHQRVRIGFVRSPVEREVIVTVNRVRQLDLPVQPRMAYQAVEGNWLDDAGRRVVTVGEDFWLSLDKLYVGHPESERRRILHQLGKAWGISLVERVESYIQEAHGETLREAELQVALQCLSGAVGLAGLGRFEVLLGYRERGLMVIRHLGSPFAGVDFDHDHERCHVLAGLHAGLLSHLSGRDLMGREVGCSPKVASPCVFVVGTEERLDRLFDAEPGSADADLRASLLTAADSAGPTAAGSEDTDG